MASPEEIIADETTIAEYLPQKPPMVMIGKLHSTVNGRTTTSFFIQDDNVLCNNGNFSEAGLIENMAQTAAAGVGYTASLAKTKPPVGFIGGIKNLRIQALPRIGDEIFTEIAIEHQVMNATVASGKVYLHQELIAECELKIFLI